MIWARLRHLAEVNPSTPEFDKLSGDADVTFAPLEAVWADSHLDLGRRRPKDEVATGYTRFRPSDILVPKVTPTFQAGRSAIAANLVNGVGAGTTELHVLRSRSGVDPRYLRYTVLSKPFLDEGVTAFQGVAGLQRVPPEFMSEYPVYFPSLEEQWRIADFLDAETSQVDAVARARTRQFDLVAERNQSLLDRILVDSRDTSVSLSKVCRLQTGVTVDAAGRSAHSDVRPYLRVANVKAEWLDLDEVREIRVTPDDVRRSTLRSGDVLMTEGGDLDKLGRGTVWRDEIPGCLHQNHVFALRPRPGLSGDFLALITRTSLARSYFERTGTKTTNLASTNSSKILAFKIPFPDQPEQHRRTSAAVCALDEFGQLSQAWARQVDLLKERRQALITAAVTGQIDVTTARGVGERIA